MQRSWHFGRFCWAVWVEARSNLRSSTGVMEQPSACPAGHSFAVFNQKSSSTSCKVQVRSCQVTAWKRSKSWRTMESNFREVWRGAGTLPISHGCNLGACAGRSMETAARALLCPGCICPEMRLQNCFLLNILSLWKASIGCYFLLLLVSPYSCAVLMWADFVRSGGLNGVWLKSEHPTTTVSQFDFVGLFIWEFRKTPLASKKGKKTQLFFQLPPPPVWLKEKQREKATLCMFFWQWACHCFSNQGKSN